MKWKNNKLILPILCFIILVILYIDNNYIFKKIKLEKKCNESILRIAEMNNEPTFKISKIIKYSSAETIDNSLKQDLQDINIHQYSDLAIYIDNMSDELTEKNTVKELYLDNFKINVKYKKGSQELYYKNPFDISKFRLIDENKIKDTLKYNIIHTNDENTENIYSNPTFYTDCSNPITIEFVNQNIVSNYKVTKNNEIISSDGRIFNNIDINLEELSPKISFMIHIKNNLDEEYICNVLCDFDLETSEGSIKSGYIIQITNDLSQYNFFRIK